MERMLPGSSFLPSKSETPRGSADASPMKKGTFGSPFFKLHSDRTRVRRARSAGFLDLVTLQALGAHPNALDSTIDADADGLKVGIPAPLGAVVRVADVVAGNRPFSADGAYPCHKVPPCRVFGT